MAPRLLHEYLLRHARIVPNELALVAGGERWTFVELARKVEALAEALRAFGVGRGDRVLLVLHPSPAAIALELAVATVGAAFVPISPEAPNGRLQAVATVAEAALLVCEADRELDREVTGGTPVALIERNELDFGEGARRYPGADVQGRPLETDPAYIIFTSGSTGAPKGIVMSHRAAVAALMGAAEMRVRPRARVGSIAPLQFDFSILDLGLSIGTGATLVLLPRLLAFQPERLVNHLVEQEVTQMDCVPSLWRNVLQRPGLCERLGQMDTLVYGGEGFSVGEVNLLQAKLPGVRVIQAFGHSESILCCFAELTNPPACSRGRVAIGKPFSGMEMFSLDDAGQVVSRPGELGELWISGSALFSGYYGDEHATRERLRPDPRAPGRSLAFRSGDIVFTGENGQYYFWGRKDAQVKIAGNRLELEEVEVVLEEQAIVKRAVVALVTEGGRADLLGFVLCDAVPSGEALRALREACGRRLPHYAVPKRLIPVSSMPMTVNGKIDRDSLVAASFRKSDAQEEGDLIRAGVDIGVHPSRDA